MSWIVSNVGISYVTKIIITFWCDNNESNLALYTMAIWVNLNICLAYILVRNMYVNTRHELSNKRIKESNRRIWDIYTE